ncbi:LAQU0S03e06744g1_1 [Lachancea quebecensis]|uniref:LAQU0S03e06744g1_1 n=1 Tax=Lachancea quebecensis TaxID=1654605 RepID=A0A0P1KPQ5_9SACH|nr:LAQU0S03e06744g1_1 [Lachancea quebecensis]
MDERSQNGAEQNLKKHQGRKQTGKGHQTLKKAKPEAVGLNTGTNSKSKKKYRKLKDANIGPAAQYKLVLRQLPPDLSEEQFLNTIFEAVDSEFLNQHVEDRYFFKGHFSRKPFKLPTYSRAYLTFYEADKLKSFARTISAVTFVDDTNNSMTPTIALSPYLKKLRTEESKGLRKNKDLVEGTIEQDRTFQTFLKSLDLLENHKQEYQYADLSVIMPLEKALRRKLEEEARVKAQGEKAMIALAGQVAKEKTKAKKKKKKKKKNNSNKAAAEGTESKKKKSKSASTNTSQDKQNMVIIEAAGRRELQRRERIKKKSENKEKKATAANLANATEANVSKAASAKAKGKAAKKNKTKRPNSKNKKKNETKDKSSNASGEKNATKAKPKSRPHKKETAE